MAPDPFYRFVVAATDPDWYLFLRDHKQHEELNFWRPGSSVTNMAKGTPWLFLIRGTSEIGGCAFFSTFSAMPIGVAWETFGEANGFPEFSLFVAKIAGLRGRPPHMIGGSCPAEW
ncbi:MAG: hypothetical protein DLM50_00155, partial [Candidatus Meridianibacter frigidus]